jgi:hypothetical protein
VSGIGRIALAPVAKRSGAYKKSHLGVLCQFQGIIDLNSEVPNCALELDVTQQELNCT